MQNQGILVARQAHDNNKLNTASNMFFNAITQVCTKANLVKKVPLTKATQATMKRKMIIKGTTVAGVTSALIAKNADAAATRGKMLLQCMQTLCTAIKKNKQHHKCANTGGEHRYDFTTIEKKRETCKELFLNLKETVSTLTATCEQIHNDRKNHVEAIRHKRNKTKI